MKKYIEYLEDIIKKGGGYRYIRELEMIRDECIKIEMLRPVQHKVIFSNLVENTCIVFKNDGNIIVPENQAYSFIFSFIGKVNDENLKICCNLAMNKVMDSVNQKIKQNIYLCHTI